MEWLPTDPKGEEPLPESHWPTEMVTVFDDTSTVCMNLNFSQGLAWPQSLANRSAVSKL